MTGLFERKKRAKSAQLTVRLDEQLKKRAELRLEAMGMTATEAVEQLYRFIAEHGRMPLQIRIVTEDALPVSPISDSTLFPAPPLNRPYWITPTSGSSMPPGKRPPPARSAPKSCSAF